MNHDYDDIRKRIPAAPLWWDEHAVPRYCIFHPQEVANIYSREAVLFLVTCQGCKREFPVAASSSFHEDRHLHMLILSRGLHYGDPPNIRCCAAGPTMNSEPRRVLEYWRKTPQVLWERDESLEIDITPDWVSEPFKP